MYHEAFERYKGYDFSDVIRLESDEQFERTRMLAKDRLSKTFSIRDGGKLLNETEIECLDLFGDLSHHKDLLLDIVACQKRLKYLAIHPSLVGMLDAFILPDGLETLAVIGGAGDAYVPEGFVHTNIERVSSVDTVLHFGKRSLPNLKHFHIRFDKKGVTRKLLCSYDQMFSASLLPTKSSEDFGELPATLRYLRLIDGSLADLSGISQLKQLTDLHLQNLPKLTNIGDVVNCGEVREVTIGYCNSIQNLERMAELKNLEKFQLFASRVNNKEEVRSKLGTLNLKEISLS